jgi:16S rRNA (adenine1518-N6/adenine1519-N6)-dimethyltransferase
MSRQPLGQHFLSSEAYRMQIFDCLPADDGIPWIEIGPGHGEFTNLLVRGGRRVVAVERDPMLADHLRERAAAASGESGAWGLVKIVEGDVLGVDLGGLVDGPFRVYGNLPYYITSPILRHVWSYAVRIRGIFTVVQREVAERLVAGPGSRDFGFLSALASFHTRPRILLKIPPGAFTPPPKVDSALVGMNLPGEDGQLGLAVAEQGPFLKFVLGCFGQKRKMLLNNLRGAFGAGRVREAIAAAGLPAGVRAEGMGLPQFAALYRAIGGVERAAGQDGS